MDRLETGLPLDVHSCLFRNEQAEILPVSQWKKEKVNKVYR